jgi:hypothetical protein
MVRTGNVELGKQESPYTTQCSTCHIETKCDAIAHKVKIVQINACQAGAFPSMIKELDEATPVNTNETEEEVQGESPALDNDLEFDADHIEIEEGDCVFMAMVHPVNPQHFICALSMVSGHLAEASVKNSTLKGFHEIVPTALHFYDNVFSKTAFNTLPLHQKWDHTIELECKPSPGFQKVYPMTLTKQTEMDAFLEEALATGCIRQSKSLLGAPVFFIKKKDGKLCFVQDYQALNAIM